jgi:hypothetical protein
VNRLAVVPQTIEEEETIKQEFPVSFLSARNLAELGKP